MMWMKQYRANIMQTRLYFGELRAFGFATNSAETVWQLYR